MTAQWLVPAGDTVAEHFCQFCGDPWALCVCEADDDEGDE